MTTLRTIRKIGRRTRRWFYFGAWALFAPFIHAIDCVETALLRSGLDVDAVAFLIHWALRTAATAAVAAVCWTWWSGVQKVPDALTVCFDVQIKLATTPTAISVAIVKGLATSLFGMLLAVHSAATWLIICCTLWPWLITTTILYILFWHTLIGDIDTDT